MSFLGRGGGIGGGFASFVVFAKLVVRGRCVPEMTAGCFALPADWAKFRMASPAGLGDTAMFTVRAGRRRMRGTSEVGSGGCLGSLFACE